MGDILSLEGRTRPDVQKEHVVDGLSEWLEMAKRGEIDSIAMTCIKTDGTTMLFAPPSDSIITLIGTLAVLQAELIANTQEVD